MELSEAARILIKINDKGHEKPTQLNQRKPKSEIISTIVTGRDTTLGAVGRRDKVIEVVTSKSIVSVYVSKYTNYRA